MRKYLLFHDAYPEFTVSTYFPSRQSAKWPRFKRLEANLIFISEVSGKFGITEDSPMFVKLSFGNEADTLFSFMQFVVTSAKVSGLFWGCWVYKDSAKILRTLAVSLLSLWRLCSLLWLFSVPSLPPLCALESQRSICECWLTIQSLVDFLPGSRLCWADFPLWLSAFPLLTRWIWLLCLSMEGETCSK